MNNKNGKQLIRLIIESLGSKSNINHIHTKSELGISNVDNTADMDKPVSTATQEALDELYEQLTAYTNQSIANIINGAPSNLDTMKEISDALATHKTLVDALDAAITKKANAAEFDSHTKDSTKHITAEERTSWKAKLATDGDASNVMTIFSQAETRANLTSKERLSVSLGKIMKWFADLMNGAASTLLGTNLTANRALVANGNGKVGVSAVTATELGYLDGVTSGIQGQFNELNTHVTDFINRSTPIRAVAGDLFNTTYGNGWYYFAEQSAHTPETYGTCFFLQIHSWSFRLAIRTTKAIYTNVNIGQGFGE